MDFQLTGLVAIVTGATRGLGRAAAEALAAEGVDVLGVGRSESSLAQLSAHKSRRIHTARCDFTDRSAVADLARYALERFGRLDIVVNNAGILVREPFETQRIDLWDAHIATNLIAPVILSRAAGEIFLAQRSGKVINVVSTAAIRGAPELTAYCSTKGALLQLTRALAVEWAGRGVQVNAIAPGAYETRMQPADLQVPGAALDDRLRRIPDGRMGQPRELGPLVCLLASPLSDHVTGALYVTDGGETARL